MQTVSLAVNAASSFTGASVAGVDLLISADSRNAKVIEANAFGDLLPNVQNQKGRSTYEEEVECLIKKRSNAEFQ
ncbi:MAG: hypothetical protein MI784_00895 [Cytophagales bacterium]|nr:hypothetical protein [Cytophagales bacterium]